MEVIRAAMIAGAVLVASCIQHTLTPCADGSTCDFGEVCVPTGGCATEANLAACGGKSDGDLCSVEKDHQTLSGVCQGGACATSMAICGNGRVEAGEECDDGNTDQTDACRGCKINRCGNGVVDAGEECDLGAQNSNAPDAACRTNCTMKRCGDKVVDTGEQCDDGNTTNGDSCNTGCKTPTCGDGWTDLAIGEVCDDGNTIDGDGCSADCHTGPASCGNGVFEPTLENCDDGNHINGDGCQANCERPRCGDHIVDSGEVCDDGNLVPGDGCDQYCHPE